MLITPAFAQSAGGINFFGMDIMQFLPLIAIFAAFYFFLIRPQQQKTHRQKEMLSTLGKGDQVLTAGGIVGTITKVVDDNELIIEIADKVEVRILRSSISEHITTARPTPARKTTSTITKKKTTTNKTSKTPRKTSKAKA